MTDGPLLWYLNRSTGVVLLVLLTIAVVLGVLATDARPRRRMPRFVSQSLHRNLALVSVAALGAHVTTAVVDSYVDIRWWQSLVPVGATYEPLWLGMGTLALDILVVVVGTSLLRTRLGLRGWRAVHLLAWGAWGLSVGHAIGIGTDLAGPDGLAVVPTAACVMAVATALVVRLTWAVRRPATALRRTA